jgi:thiol:disulfide interchange protein
LGCFILVPLYLRLLILIIFFFLAASSALLESSSVLSAFALGLLAGLLAGCCLLCSALG